jgi:hypothetical protein
MPKMSLANRGWTFQSGLFRIRPGGFALGPSGGSNLPGDCLKADAELAVEPFGA